MNDDICPICFENPISKNAFERSEYGWCKKCINEVFQTFPTNSVWTDEELIDYESMFNCGEDY